MEKITKKQIKKHLKRWKEAHAKIEAILHEQDQMDTRDLSSALWPHIDINGNQKMKLIVTCRKDSLTPAAEKYLLENN